MQRPIRFLFLISSFFILAVLLTSILWGDDSDLFFDDTYVHAVRIYFEDPGWYDTLYQSHATNPEDPYFPARFVYGDIEMDPVGVRFKGNSSFSIPGVKKSIKIDFDEYDEDNDELAFLGLKKLNLNNGFRDPTLLREKLFLDFAGRFLPAPRVVHARVYINDIYWGLYAAVEQVDKTFAQRSFGSSEDGNLFKGQASDDMNPGGDFGSDLTWLGSDPGPYHDCYQLKTNEEEDDYSQLIAFIDVLNNTETADLSSELEPIFDVRGTLYALALNNLFVNLDAYNSSAHNYYLYDRDDTGKITHIHWDTNDAFGRFLMFNEPGENPLELDPFWLPGPIGPPGNQKEQLRPLMVNLWAYNQYSNDYLCALRSFLDSGFNPDDFSERIVELADLIRQDIYADSNKMYSNSQFEQNLFNDIVMGRETIYGLHSFVQERESYMRGYLAGENPVCQTAPPHVSEISISPALPTSDDTVMVSASIQDDQGIALPELFYRVDDGGWVELPMIDEGDNLYSAIIPAFPDGSRVDYYLYAEDYTGEWIVTPDGAPDAFNSYTIRDLSYQLYINEFMADNDSTIEDPDGNGGFPDWIEIYNPSASTVDLSGMYMTDDLNEPLKWEIPAGVEIGPLGYLLIWADNDPEQGSSHAEFKLSSSGEEIGIFDTDRNGNRALDVLVFGEQSADVSYGRYPDGGEEWRFFAVPTPGALNGNSRSHGRPFGGP